MIQFDATKPPQFFANIVLLLTTFLLANVSAICGPPKCNTLEELYAIDMIFKIPHRNNGSYIVPNQTNLDDFESIVSHMMMLPVRNEASENCPNIDLRSLSDKYDIDVFTDAINSIDYCVLVTKDISYPWSNVIINLNRNASMVKDLSIDCAHPRYDVSTGEQSIAIFKGTNSRSFIVAGTHRFASDKLSPCDYGKNPHRISDAAHSITNCFHSAVKAIMDYYESTNSDYTAVQFHGMGSSSCLGVDAYFTHGTDGKSTVHGNNDEKITAFRNELATLVNGTFTIPGEVPACNLNGRMNIQGRMINGVDSANACTVGSDGQTGRFIHLEQKWWLRSNNSTMHEIWTIALNNAYASFIKSSTTQTISTATSFDTSQIPNSEQCSS